SQSWGQMKRKSEVFIYNTMSITDQGDIFNSVTTLIVHELKTNGVNLALDTTQYVNKINALITVTKAKIGDQNLQQATAYLSHNELISQVVKTCVTKLQTILQ